MLLLMVLFPLLGYAILGLYGKRMREPWAGVMASGAVLASFVLGVVQLAQGGARWTIADWLPGIPFSLSLDNLSGLMVMIVAGIGFLIHVYAIGYMHGDEGFSRFFSYFNLFIAAMLTLVLADAFPVMFIGWEGVGLASYLLIGFWYKDKVNVDSARKAFIVNRIGDLGFLLGMGLLWSMFGTLSISEIKEKMETIGLNVEMLSVAAALLFIGAIGKSAQVPLMVWLPDAMAGPTPVSALIHAATMVTAGVYMICRSSFIYAETPDVSLWIALVGLITAAYGALAALGQWDIKRIVAYTTVSTLGFMMLAAGLGAYWVALFQLLTHAFYKALMFMVSGAVIHALGGEQDVRKMGGLHKYLPQTHVHGLIGALAMGGFPLLSGFWAKDQILAATLSSDLGGWVFYLAALLVAFITAFYAVRWYVLVFMGEYRGSKPPQEAPAILLWPDHLLAVGAILAGLLALPKPLPNTLEPFLGEALSAVEQTEPSLRVEWLLIGLSAAVAVAGFYGGFRFFQKGLPGWYNNLQGWFEQGFFVDQQYNTLLVRPLRALAGLLLEGERTLLAGYRGLGRLMAGLGSLLARLESGHVRLYAGGLVLGVVLLLLWGVLTLGGSP